MQKITPFLWFNDNAEEAMDFYVRVFPNSKIINKNKGPDGKLFTGEIELNSQRIMVLNGGPQFKFNEAVSFFVSCDSQDEVDMYWNKLTANGGEESMCGWLKDKFGLSWQIVPKLLGQLLGDPQKSPQVMQAMLQMHKFDCNKLQEAYDQA